MAELISPPKKPFPVLAIFIPTILLLLGLSGYFYTISLRETSARKALAGQLAALQQEKDSVAKELAQTKAEFETLQKSMDEAMKDVDTAKAAKDTAEAALKNKTDEIAKIQADSQKRIADLEQEVKHYADFSATLSMELQPIKDALGFEVSNPAATQAGGVSAVTPAGEFPSLIRTIDLVAGKVTTVNKEFDFILINLGAKSGALPGRSVKIYQGEEMVGLGQIEKSQSDTSAVSIASKDLIERVRPGDKVVLV